MHPTPQTRKDVFPWARYLGNYLTYMVLILLYILWHLLTMPRHL